MIYLYAFLVGGAICVIGQLILEYTKLTSGQILVMFTIAGAVLSGFGIYDKLVQFSGAGALVPVMGFGHSMTTGALIEAQRLGVIGLFSGAFEFTGLGLVSAVFFGSFFALIFDPKA